MKIISLNQILSSEVSANRLQEQFEELAKVLQTMQKQLNNLEEVIVPKIEDEPRPGRKFPRG